VRQFGEIGEMMLKLALAQNKLKNLVLAFLSIQMILSPVHALKDSSTNQKYLTSKNDPDFHSTLKQALPPPSELLNQARQDSFGLRDAIFSIDRNLMEFTTLEELTPYAELIPEFRVLYKKYGLDAIYPKLLDRFEEAVHTAAIKWLDIKVLASKTVVFYSDFASFNSALKWLGVVDAELNIERDINKLKKGVQNLSIANEVFTKKFTQKKDVDITVRNIQSRVAAKQIANSEVTSSEIDFWLNYLKTETGIVAYVDASNDSLFALKPEEGALGKSLFKRNRKVTQVALSYQDEFASYVFSALYDQAIEILYRSLRFGWELEKNDIKDALNELPPVKLKQLSEKIQYGDIKKVAPEFAPYFEWLIIALINRLESSRLNLEARNLEQFLNKVLAPIKLSSAFGEGVYHLKDDQGKSYRFTLVLAKDSMLIASLSDNLSYVDRSFFSVAYDSNLKRFIATPRDPDQDPAQIGVIEFELLPQNALQLWDRNRVPELVLSGHKLASFDMEPEQILPKGSVHGSYKGLIYFDPDKPVLVDLVITELNQSLIGNLRMIDSQTGHVINRIDYPIGGSSTSSIIKLTSGRLVSGAFNHLRLFYRAQGKISGYMIVGARYEKPVLVELEKMNQIK